MTTDEIMKMAAEKAFQEVSWESIEYLFRPSNVLELLLRSDFEGTKKKINDWFLDESPDAMPWRFRSAEGASLLRAVKAEEFYREITRLQAAP